MTVLANFDRIIFDMHCAVEDGESIEVIQALFDKIATMPPVCENDLSLVSLNIATVVLDSVEARFNDAGIDAKKIVELNEFVEFEKEFAV